MNYTAAPNLGSRRLLDLGGRHVRDVAKAWALAGNPAISSPWARLSPVADRLGYRAASSVLIDRKQMLAISMEVASSKACSPPQFLISVAGRSVPFLPITTFRYE